MVGSEVAGQEVASWGDVGATSRRVSGRELQAGKLQAEELQAEFRRCYA